MGDLNVVVVVGALLALVCICGGEVRHSRHWLVRAFAYEHRVLGPAYQIEKDIGSGCSRFAEVTQGWEESGRTAESLLEARAVYKAEEAGIIREAIRELRSIEAEANRLGLESVLGTILARAPEQYPVMGMLAR